MSCGLDEHCARLLAENGAKVSPAYSQKIASIMTSLAYYGQDGLDADIRTSAALALNILIGGDPKVLEDVKAVAASDPEFAAGLERFLADQQAAEQEPEAEMEDELEDEPVDWADDLDQADLMDMQMEASASMYNDLLDALLGEYPYFEEERDLARSLARLAREVSEAADPESGNGILSTRCWHDLVRAEKDLAELIESPPRDVPNRLLDYYTQLILQLRESMASVEGPRERWVQPPLVVPFHACEFFQSDEEIEIWPLNMDEWGEYEPLFQEMYREALQEELEEFAHDIFPPYRMDQKMAVLAASAADLLDLYAREGDREALEDALGKMKMFSALLQEARDPRSRAAFRFPTEAVRLSFLAHYQAVQADLDGLRRGVEEGIKTKPKEIESFAEKTIYARFKLME